MNYFLRKISAWLGISKEQSTYIGGGAPLSYPSVTEDASMKISAVYSALKLISEGVARLPLELQRYNSVQQRYVDDYNRPLYTVLRLCPNGSMNAFSMWSSAILQMLLYGNAYLLPERDASDEVISLTLLSANSVTHDIANRVYQINDAVNGIHAVVKPGGIVHLKNLGNKGGHSGDSTIDNAIRAIGINLLADDNTATTLSNGGRMRGILSGNTPMNSFADATTKQLKDVSNRIENDMRDGRLVVPVPSDMKFQPITLSPADAKVLESKQFSISDIARFFRVHPDLLYAGSNNTYKAAEIPNVMFLVQTLEPLLAQIEAELLVKLIPRGSWGWRRVRFDREVLYMTDLQTKSVYYEKMLQTGIYTVNELRRREGQSPVEGGDKPLVSANLKTIDTIINENNNEQKDN